MTTLSKEQLEANLRLLILHHPPFGYPLTVMKKIYSDMIPYAACVIKNDIMFNLKHLQVTTECKTALINYVAAHEFCHVWDDHYYRTLNQIRIRFGESNIHKISKSQYEKVNKLSKVCNILQDALINDKLNILAEKHNHIKMPSNLWTIDDVNTQFKLNPPLTINSKFEDHIDDMLKNCSDEQADGDMPLEIYYNEETGELLGADGKELSMPKEMKDLLRKEISRGLKQEDLNRARGNNAANWELIFPDLTTEVPAEIVKRELLARVTEAFGSIRCGIKRKMHPSKKIVGYPYTFKPKKSSSHVIFLVDTSGSVQSYVAKFYGALMKLQKKLKLTVTVIPCDVQVGEIIRNAKKLPDKFKNSGGGTDLTAGLDWIDANIKKDELDSTVIMVMTDGYTGWRTPPCKTIAIYTPEHSHLSPAPNKSMILMDTDQK